MTTKLGNGWAPSIRLATNGRARIVYSGQSALEYAVAATASGGFSTTKIPHTTGEDIHPMLSLDTQGYAAAAWTHAPYVPGPWTVRYSTRKSGSWSAPVTVATSSDGFGAVAFDMDTLGRPNIVIANTGDDKMLRDVRLAGGTWTTSTIVGPLPLVRAVSVHRAFSATDRTQPPHHLTVPGSRWQVDVTPWRRRFPS